MRANRERSKDTLWADENQAAQHYGRCDPGVNNLYTCTKFMSFTVLHVRSAGEWSARAHANSVTVTATGRGRVLCKRGRRLFL